MPDNNYQYMLQMPNDIVEMVKVIEDENFNLMRTAYINDYLLLTNTNIVSICNVGVSIQPRIMV